MSTMVGLDGSDREDAAPAPGHGAASGVTHLESLSFEREGDAIVVHLHRGPCNEIGLQTLADLETLVAFLADGAGGARAVIFESDLDAGFCAGADLRELYQGIVARREAGQDPGDRRRELQSFIDRIHAVFDALDMLPMTTVAATHGVVFGGGFELALTCDVIIADKTTRFCFPELRLGLVPGFGGIPRLQRDLGNATVRDLLLTGRSIRASRAFEVGLVSQLVAPGQAKAVARSVAAQAARFDRAVTAQAKPFLKPFPKEALAEEKALFLSMFESPVVEAALRRFVESNDVRPYLP